MDDRGARVGTNEALFRELNEELRAMSSSERAPMTIVCECGRLRCTELIEISGADYEKLRSDPTCFVVLPGHELPDLEEVVARLGRYSVVRKDVGLPEEIAIATDPRS